MKKIIFVIVIIGLVVGGFVLVKNKKRDLASKPALEEFALNGKIYTPKNENIQLISQALATVKSDNKISFSSKLPLRIVSMKTIGEKVRKGGLLIELDSSDIMNDITNVELDIQSAKTDLVSKSLQVRTLEENHQRSLKLYKVGAISTEQIANEKVAIANMQSSKKSAEARIEILQNKKIQLQNLLSYTKFYAPFDGVVSEQNGQIGEITTPYKPLIVFANEKKKYLELTLPSTINPKGIRYKGDIVSLQKLPTAKNSMNQYISKEFTIDETIDANINIELLLYNDKGYFFPNDTFLQVNNKNYLLVYLNGKVTKKEIEFVMCGNEGCVVKEDMSGLKILQAKPDVMLKALSGMKIAIKG
ncbi:MAG: hypothetical protein IE916_06350 [Epsilonproteobacteria bacterium]|nr:hypothetical protein [Campylobacterota bacterium]MBD3824112.1 hypothetical protein [Campylobacterota bacterium]